MQTCRVRPTKPHPPWRHVSNFTCSNTYVRSNYTPLPTAHIKVRLKYQIKTKQMVQVNQLMILSLLNNPSYHHHGLVSVKRQGHHQTKCYLDHLLQWLSVNKSDWYVETKVGKNGRSGTKRN